MLLRLTISDFALLQHSGIEFRPGLTAITGETGAGKSLLVGAFTFLAGGRPPFDVVREGARRAVVEGEFRSPTGESLILRRQLGADGRSRSFIDDTPVSQSELAEISARLLDITTQRAFSKLLDPRCHLDILDSFAGLRETGIQLQHTARAYNNTARRIAELTTFLAERKTRREHLRRQIAEIDEISPEPDEERQISEEIRRLEHFEELQLHGSKVVELLRDGKESAEIQLSQALKLIESISEIDAALSDLKQDLENSLAAVREISHRVGERCKSGDYENNHLEKLRARLHSIVALVRRYGGSFEALLKLRQEGITELEEGTDAEVELENAHFDLDRHRRNWVELASAVSKIRREASTKIEEAVTRSLAGLGIGDPRFEVRLERTGDADGLLEEGGHRWKLTERGAEDAVFYFSANSGIESKPIATVASGGELSRVMLALKECLPLQSEEATLLFDEIDTGVSGRTARLVGKKMKAIASGRQLLVITHLPQIASLADNHLKVIKSERGGETFTEVIEIDGDDRRIEIAGMLSGGSVSQEALHQADLLLKGD